MSADLASSEKLNSYAASSPDSPFLYLNSNFVINTEVLVNNKLLVMGVGDIFSVLEVILRGLVVGFVESVAVGIVLRGFGGDEMVLVDGVVEVIVGVFSLGNIGFFLGIAQGLGGLRGFVAESADAENGFVEEVLLGTLNL